MFPRSFWTAAFGYLLVAAILGWMFASFVRPADEAASPSPDRLLVWGAALAVALSGLGVTWIVLRAAGARLARLTAAGLEDGSTSARLLLGRPPSLDSAIETMNRHLETRVAELQRKGQQLQESTTWLETVLGSMIEGVIAVDAGRRIVFANQAARGLLDIQEAGTAGRPIWEVIRNARIDDVIRDVLGGESCPPLEIDLPRKHAVVAVMASRLPGDPSTGAVLVLHDMTELRRLENVRREFVSNVSHELKTPLTAIQAYTETLLDGALDEPDHRYGFVERIAEQANRLHALIHDLLQLARIESGESVFQIGPVPVGPVADGCLEEQSTIAQAKSQTLVALRPDDDIRVLADDNGLRMILSNLLDNAVKYTPEGGRVTLRWRAEDGEAVIEVADDGPGIAPEHLPRIFERFYRVDKARSGLIEGTGLGLSIVKHLAQEFSGSVGVSSRLGAGTTFVVRLPRA
jgi:two-component system phosphate regulon sensor histidine kinase PhoR